MSKRITYRSAAAGRQVCGYIYQPMAEVRGVLQISHGMSEHFNRYKEFIDFMLAKGYVLCGNDHLGHGETTEELKGFMGKKAGYANMAEDMRFLMKQVKKEYPHVPYYLLGHSMGSFISRYFAEKWGYDLNGLILSGSGELNTGEKALYNIMLGYIKAASMKKGAQAKAPELTRLTSYIFNARFLSEGDGCAWQTLDLTKRQDFKADPLCRVKFTYGGYRDLLGVTLRTSNKKSAARLPEDLPVLLVSGDMDPIGGFGSGVKRLYKTMKEAGLTDVTMKLYKNGRHEMLNEINRKEVFNYIYEWIQARERAI